MIPVGVVAREARDFPAEDKADVAQRDLGRECLEVVAPVRRRRRLAEIGVERLNPALMPAQRHGALDQRALIRLAFHVDPDLFRAGLADIDDRLPLQVNRSNLRRGEAELVSHATRPTCARRAPARRSPDRWR